MIKIAVYGTLRRGFGNYQYLLADQRFMGQETVELPMRMVSLGGFPGLIASEEETEVVIEVFEIDEEAFRSVDGLEGYPRFYNRKEIDTSFGKAWIYYLEDADNYKGSASVPNGDWKEYVQSKVAKRYEILSED